jgi:hypothetical protein
LVGKDNGPFLKALEEKLGRPVTMFEMAVTRLAIQTVQEGDVRAFNALLDRLEGKPLSVVAESDVKSYWEQLDGLDDPED